MKFCKRYEDYIQGRREKELPAVGLKKLKKTLMRCRREFQSQNLHQDGGEGDGSKYNGNCAEQNTLRSIRREAIFSGVVLPAHHTSLLSAFEFCCFIMSVHVCDGTFFPSLLKEMSAVVGCFNQRAQKLLELHLASGFHKYIMWFRGKSSQDHGAMIQEGKDLVAYAIINSIAMRKILKKYDKIHYSNRGQAFKSKALSMHIEILQSPWLCELMAFYINMRQGKTKNKAIVRLFGDCSLTFDDDGKPALSCGLFDSMKVEIDLTCSVCLDTVFDPVALTCGHLFCYMCCCSAASVTIVDGLKAASPKAKCPLCRHEGVHAGAVHLDELNILLSHSCPDYWEKRLRTEREERVRQAKEDWQSLSRAFMGM